MFNLPLIILNNKIYICKDLNIFKLLIEQYEIFVTEYYF